MTQQPTDGAGQPTTDAFEVRHTPEDNRYEVWAAGERAGFAAYVVDGDRITFTHTEVADRFEGQGVGSVLVRGALDDVRRGGRFGVVAECPFVAEWLARHPDQQDVLPD
ncbi:GNAT family N-acetyltransferase [Nocardioides sp. AX2bis]|uniref:GNAT family N-acetyltransferase n=1 Tax=Nocardioides sp. AX2bis TaxID=2653157 RepID=UPI001358FF0B|nr:GNAT family N-acetyltransferase [Nocardioides sp. AX2bis]